MARVVVVGAGVGGMAAALRLSVKGHDVILVEQSGRAGGKLATYRRAGFAFDTGPSLFTLPAVYRDLFLRTGAALEDVVDLQPVEPGFAYHWADGTEAALPGVGVAAVASALGDALGGRAREDWLAFMAHAAAVWGLTRAPVLESAVTGPRDLLALARSREDVRTVAPFTTLRRLGRRTFHDPRLVTLLDRYATYTGSDPRRAPAALATVPYVEQTFGVWHLGGGLGTLADALLERCLERGVTVRFDADVRRIRTDAHGVTGVELAGAQVIPADLVVANADAADVYGHLVDDARARPARRRLARATPSLSGFVLLLALRGRTPGLLHHNVWFPDDYDAEFDTVFGRHAEPVADPAVYVCAPDDDTMRPDSEHESWFLLVNAPRHSPDGRPRTLDWDTPGLADRYADHLLDLLARRGTDVRDRLLWREIRTPSDLARASRAPGGSIYGTSSNGPRSAFLRAANASPVPGLYLVGGSAHPGGGLPLVGMGAEIVAGLVGRA